MTPSWRRSAGWLGALLGALVTACGPEPVAVLTGLELVVAEGDGQFGTAGQTLGTALRAVVRVSATQNPQEDVSVLWEVEQGSATLVGATTVTSDSTGAVEVRVRLGAAPDEVVVRARAAAQASATTTFTLHTVEQPVLSAVAPSAAAPGDTVTLTGLNFSPVAIQDVVLFSGIRGTVSSASATELRVVVPRCLPARDVAVRVQLGTIASGSVPLTVTGGGETTSLAVGEVLDVADDGGFACYALQGDSGVEYLTLVYSASTVGAAMHPYRLTALSSAVAPAASVPVAMAPRREEGGRLGDRQAVWDERLREMEAQAWASAPVRTAPAVGVAAVPSVGDSRTFHVLKTDGTYQQVTATAELVGTQAAIFVDEEAPDGGFTPADLQALAARFDDVIHPEVTSVFGQESDLDGNDRVIILFTPAVNSLTPRGASGFVGGFFFGNDLIPDNTGSNAGEVFYALVPDPDGVFSDPRSKSSVLSAVPAILAHEFQHMVHFNERFLTLDGGQEALWLSEGLAQMAEEVVARRYLELDDATSAALFRSGTRERSTRYLRGTDRVSLIVSTGQGSLEERGAGFLHVLYLEDQEGLDVLWRLTSTTRTGVANVEAEVGRDWPELVSDWWSAIYLDGPGPESGPLVYPAVDLRGFMGANQFPLALSLIDAAGTTSSGVLWSSAAAYYIVSPDPAGSLTMRLGGEAGGPSSEQAVLRMRIIRVS